MTSNNTINTIHFIADQTYLIGYLLNFIFGVIGNSINIVIFSTKLKGSTCSLYLLSSEICNTILLLISLLLSGIISRIHRREIPNATLSWCKANQYIFLVFITVSTVMLCLASIDRFFSTCRSARQRQWSSIKNTKILITISITVSCVFHIPDIFYTGTTSTRCGYESEGYKIYIAYILNPILLTFLPFIILFVFNWLTYRNLKILQATRNEYRTQNHLFKLLILQSLCFFVGTIGNSICDIYYLMTEEHEKSMLHSAIDRLFSAATSVIYWTYPSSSFYVYYFSSKNYRSRVNELFKCKRAPTISGNITQRTIFQN